MRARTVLLAASIAWGCGAAPAPEDPDSSLTILFPSDEWVLAPANETVAKMLVFQPLFEEAEDGTVVGKLARSWEASADYRTWTYHLRSDARWDDGQPVTARDVAFSLELLMHPEIGYETPVLDSAVVLNDTTLRLHLSEGIDARYVWAVTYPEHHVAPLVADSVTSEAFWYWDFWLRPVGSGPYRYVRHVPKTLVELEANPHFFGGAPKIRRVVLKLSAASPVTELLSGQVDAAVGVGRTELIKLRADPRFRIYDQISPIRFSAVYWNHRSPLFSDARVRRALIHAVDRRELLELLDLPRDLPLTDVVHSEWQARRGVLPPPLAFDTAAAGALLTEAGWIDRDGDGIREREGRPFRFRTTASARPSIQKQAVFLQAQLARVGVAMEIQSLDLSLIGTRYRSGEWEALIAPLTNRRGGALRGYRADFGAEGATGWRHAAMQAFMDGYEVPEVYSLDPLVEDSAYRALWPVFLEEAPVLLLHPQVTAHVVHRKVKGLRSPYRTDPVRWLEHLWIEEEP